MDRAGAGGIAAWSTPSRSQVEQGGHPAAWPEIVTFMSDLGGDTSLTIPPLKAPDAQTSCCPCPPLATPAFAQANDRQTSSAGSAALMAATSSPSWQPPL